MIQHRDRTETETKASPSTAAAVVAHASGGDLQLTGLALDYLLADAYTLSRYITVVPVPYGHRRGRARRS